MIQSAKPKKPQVGANKGKNTTIGVAACRPILKFVCSMLSDQNQPMSCAWHDWLEPIAQDPIAGLFEALRRAPFDYRVSSAGARDQLSGLNWPRQRSSHTEITGTMIPPTG
jgi:hypothetical protein